MNLEYHTVIPNKDLSDAESLGAVVFIHRQTLLTYGGTQVGQFITVELAFLCIQSPFSCSL